MVMLVILARMPLVDLVLVVQKESVDREDHQVDLASREIRRQSEDTRCPRVSCYIMLFKQPLS